MAGDHPGNLADAGGRVVERVRETFAPRRAPGDKNGRRQHAEAEAHSETGAQGNYGVPREQLRSFLRCPACHIARVPERTTEFGRGLVIVPLLKMSVGFPVFVTSCSRHVSIPLRSGLCPCLRATRS